MSLYVGHLSPRICREELEQVFRRFGRCSVQLKDGFGFVIYEVTANAAKAMRVLRGKSICGEQISLNWSKRQPKPSQRSTRDNIYYEPYRRNFRVENNGKGFHDRRDFTDQLRVRPRPHTRVGRHLDAVRGKEASRIDDDVDDPVTGKRVSSQEGVVDEGGPSELNPLVNDRWGEPASDSLYSHERGNSSEFDRYEPYYHRRENENNQMDSPYGFKDQGTSQERSRWEHSFDKSERDIDKSKLQQICHNCGHVGHIMCSCPHRDSRREKFSKINHRRTETNSRDRNEGRVKRLVSNSRGGRSIHKEHLVSKRHIHDRREPNFKEARRMSRSGSESSVESREKGRRKPRADSQAKKKRKVEIGTSKKVLKRRKMKRSSTSSLSSDSSSTRSHSQSKSLGSTSGTSSSSDSRSRSLPSWSPSKSSSSRSMSSYAKSQSSRSRSKSSPKSLQSPSLSVSLDKQKPFYPERTNGSPKSFPEGNLEFFCNPESEHHIETSEPAGACSVLKGENVLEQSKVDYETIKNHQESDGHDAHYSSDNVGDKEHNSCSDMHKDVDVTSEYQGIKCGLNGTKSMKPNFQVPVRYGGSSSTRMSSQETLRALRHYGLPTPAENESNISVDRYFGAARLWPWEIIYYRRLKKGPISKENYDRRLEQNKEYGIVDKYVRSSSGWGESDQFGS